MSFVQPFTPQGLQFNVVVSAGVLTTAPAGFATGGNALRVYNPAANGAITVSCYNSTGVTPKPATIPASPGSGFGTTIAPGAVEVFGIDASSDTISVAGTAAGSIIVQRGDGM